MKIGRLARQGFPPLPLFIRQQLQGLVTSGLENLILSPRKFQSTATFPILFQILQSLLGGLVQPLQGTRLRWGECQLFCHYRLQERFDARQLTDLTK